MAGCIIVAAFVLLTNLPHIWSFIATFIGFFRVVIYACIIAYIVNPLARFFERHPFKGMKKDSLRGLCSNIVAFVLVMGVVIFAILLMLPQLVESIAAFIDNLDDYSSSIAAFLESNSFTSGLVNVESLERSGESLIQNLNSFIKQNLDTILDTGLSIGKGFVTVGIALIMSVYLLIEKNNLKAGALRLMRACFRPSNYDAVIEYLRRCDAICNRYIVFNIIDSAIIGSICAVFMTITGMPYVGLVAFIVGLTNLIPTFGPIIGGVIGGFILLIVNPLSAFLFVLFVVALQFFDGYILKPRLFGNTLGVGGLWILIAVIVGGTMIGVVGMLIAIPAIAIIDFTYHDYLLPWLERRRAVKDEIEIPVDAPANGPEAEQAEA